MNEYVKKLVSKLEPLIIDLDDKMIELDMKKEKLESISRFLAYVNGDVNLVGVYADQDLVMECLESINSNKEEYKASCYLLQSDDENVKDLPQYKEANLYILELINYFKEKKGQLSKEIQELEQVCEEKKLCKKYFEILNNDQPFIRDVFEFEEVLDRYATSSEEKINVLLYVINSNVINYQNEE